MKGLQIGRIVHYVDEDRIHKAAIVTRIDGEASVNLQVFGPTLKAFPRAVFYDESGLVPNTWHWPEKVEE